MFHMSESSVCTPQVVWEMVVPQIETLSGSLMVESFCRDPISMTLVLLGWMAIIFSKAQLLKLLAPVCRCDLTVLMDVPDLTKVVSST